MEAHRDLIGGHGNLVERNPEIAFARPELARR